MTARTLRPVQPGDLDRITRADLTAALGAEWARVAMERMSWQFDCPVWCGCPLCAERRSAWRAR